MLVLAEVVPDPAPGQALQVEAELAVQEPVPAALTHLVLVPVLEVEVVLAEQEPVPAALAPLVVELAVPGQEHHQQQAAARAVVPAVLHLPIHHPSLQVEAELEVQDRPLSLPRALMLPRVPAQKVQQAQQLQQAPQPPEPRHRWFPAAEAVAAHPLPPAAAPCTLCRHPGHLPQQEEDHPAPLTL